MNKKINSVVERINIGISRGQQSNEVLKSLKRNPNNNLKILKWLTVRDIIKTYYSGYVEVNFLKDFQVEIRIGDKSRDEVYYYDFNYFKIAMISESVLAERILNKNY